MLSPTIVVDRSATARGSARAVEDSSASSPQAKTASRASTQTTAFPDVLHALRAMLRFFVFISMDPTLRWRHCPDKGITGFVSGGCVARSDAVDLSYELRLGWVDCLSPNLR